MMKVLISGSDIILFEKIGPFLVLIGIKGDILFIFPACSFEERSEWAVRM